MCFASERTLPTSDSQRERSASCRQLCWCAVLVGDTLQSPHTALYCTADCAELKPVFHAEVLRSPHARRLLEHAIDWHVLTSQNKSCPVAGCQRMHKRGRTPVHGSRGEACASRRWLSGSPLRSARPLMPTLSAPHSARILWRGRERPARWAAWRRVGHTTIQLVRPRAAHERCPRLCGPPARVGRATRAR